MHDLALQGQSVYSKSCKDLIDDSSLSSSETIKSDSTNSQIKSNGFRSYLKNKIIYLIKGMKARIKKWLLILVALATVLTAFQQSTLVTRKTRRPVKLFSSPDSLIDDYEFGSLSKLLQNTFKYEVSFIMHYTPWDLETMRFINDLELIAKHFSNQIYFASINCWWPEGECKKTVKIRKYPLLIALVKNAGEVQYTGPLVASYIITFLENILNSVTQIIKTGDLDDLRSSHDLVVVGYFDFSRPSHLAEYKKYFTASIKSLYTDPWQRIKFAVVSSRKNAFKLGVQKMVSFSLYSWNTTLVSQELFKDSDSLLKWIHRNKNQGKLVTWITPSGFKSDILFTFLTRRNTLILFTPRSLIFCSSSYFHIMREVVMDYYNCGKSPIVQSLIHRSILKRKAREEKLIELEERCHEILETNSTENKFSWKSANTKQKDTCCHSKIVKWKPYHKTFFKKCYCTACFEITSKCPSCSQFDCLNSASKYLNYFDPVDINPNATFCNEIKVTMEPSYNPNLKITVTCSGKLPSTNGAHLFAKNQDAFVFSNETDFSESSQWPINDEKIQNMINNLDKDLCSKLSFELNYSGFNFPNSGRESDLKQNWRQGFTGLGCSTNKTLDFIAIDSILFPSFAQSLGLDVLKESYSTVAFIIEAGNENVYLLNHEIASKLSSSMVISKQSVYQFIKNYTQNSLTRFLKSSLSLSQFQFCSNQSDSFTFCIQDLTSTTFKQTVLISSKDVVVMYYTNWCAFCDSVSHIYLSVSRLFKDIDAIEFTRIEADSNDLPFEYSVDKYPTIIMFPANRKSESVKFIWELPITGANLLSFILNNAQPLVRWRIYFQLCDKPCLLRNSFLFNKKLTQAFRTLKHFLSNYIFFHIKLESTKLSHHYLYQNYLQDLIDTIRNQKNLIKFYYNLKSVIQNKLLKNDQQVAGDDYLFNEILQNYSKSQLQLNQELESSKEDSIDELVKKMNLKKNLKSGTKDEL